MSSLEVAQGPEQKENREFTKEYFELQVKFAKKLSEVTPISLADALISYTNFYRRFALGRVGDPNNPAWREFISWENGEDIAERAYQLYLKSKEKKVVEESQTPTFGCFKYDYLPETKTIQIHFKNREKNGSPFKDLEKRKEELRAMFTHIKTKYPEAEEVQGGSWLYNLEKYRSIFPQEYTQDLTPTPHPYRGMASWGQFLNRDHKIRPETAKLFLEKLQLAQTREQVFDSFPLKALRAQSEIQHFYNFLGID